MTESRRYNCFIRNGGTATPKHAGPEAKGSNPTTGLILLWARNPLWGNFNHWQVSRKGAGQIFLKRRHGCEKGTTIKYGAWNIRGLEEKEEETDKTLTKIILKYQ